MTGQNISYSLTFKFVSCTMTVNRMTLSRVPFTRTINKFRHSDKIVMKKGFDKKLSIALQSNLRADNRAQTTSWGIFFIMFGQLTFPRIFGPIKQTSNDLSVEEVAVNAGRKVLTVVHFISQNICEVILDQQFRAQCYKLFLSVNYGFL